MPGAVSPDDDASAAMRASDADRDAVIELLKARTADGSLTLDEFAERVDSALSARTRGDLDVVKVDLAGAPRTSTTRRSPTGTVLSVMAGAGKRGRWRCG